MKQKITTFEFSQENLAEAKKYIAKYPAGRQRSAVMPLLDLAQRQNSGWISTAAMDYIANMLEIPAIKVYEVASFYSMYNLKPVGKNLIQVCRTTPCWLRGSDMLTHACKDRLGIGLKETTPDGNFTLVEVECLGACVNAPMVQINDDYFEDLTADSMVQIIDDLAAGKKVKVGSQTGRQCSAPLEKIEN
jgi:NADH-quinone oxidoreductase subunit E